MNEHQKRSCFNCRKTSIYSPVWFVFRTKMADSALWLVKSPVSQTPCEGSIALQSCATVPHWSNCVIASPYISSYEIKRLFGDKNNCRFFFFLSTLLIMSTNRFRPIWKISLKWCTLALDEESRQISLLEEAVLFSLRGHHIDDAVTELLLTSQAYTLMYV